MFILNPSRMRLTIWEQTILSRMHSNPAEYRQECGLQREDRKKHLLSRNWPEFADHECKPVYSVLNQLTNQTKIIVL